MHIGYFTHSPVVVSETFIHDLIYALNERSSQLTVFSGATSGCDLRGVNVIHTGYHALAEARSQRRYMIGQVMGRRGDLLRFNYARAAACRIVRQHADALATVDVAYIDYGFSSASLFPLLESMGIPFIVHVHGYDVTAAFSSTSYKKAFLASCKAARCVIAASQHVRRLLILAGVAPSRIRVIRYGVSGDHIIPMSWEHRRQGPPSIVHLGRLTEKKHPIALLHAFHLVNQAIPESTLSIIGDGPLRHDVENRIRQLGLEKAVTLHGALPRDASYPLMNRHWVFAQHSVTASSGDQEGFAISPAEGALHGLPVVSTIHNGINEHVVDGATGYLVPEHNFEAMSERIIQLLRDPALAETMGHAGRERILSLCDPEKRTDAIYALLKHACTVSDGHRADEASGPQLALSDA